MEKHFADDLKTRNLQPLKICSVLYLCPLLRARERLAQARIEAKIPGPEKAAKKQELHRKLRVSKLQLNNNNNYYYF